MLLLLWSVAMPSASRFVTANKNHYAQIISGNVPVINTDLKAGKIENIIILSLIICTTQHSKTLAKSNNLVMLTPYSSTTTPTQEK